MQAASNRMMIKRHAALVYEMTMFLKILFCPLTAGRTAN